MGNPVPNTQRLRGLAAREQGAPSVPPPHLAPGPGSRQRSEPTTGRKMVIWVRSPTRRGAAARQSLDASLPSSAVPGFGAPAHRRRCPAERGAAFRLGECPGKR